MFIYFFSVQDVHEVNKVFVAVVVVVHEYRSYCVWSVLTTSVKILPYRPPNRLIIGANNGL